MSTLVVSISIKERERRHYPTLFNQPGIPEYKPRGRQYISHGYGDEKVLQPHPPFTQPQYTEYAIFPFQHRNEGLSLLGLAHSQWGFNSYSHATYYNLSFLSVCLFRICSPIYWPISTKRGRKVRGRFRKDLSLLVPMAFRSLMVTGPQMAK